MRVTLAFLKSMVIADWQKVKDLTQPKVFSGWVSSFVMCPGAADKDAGQKIDSHHTSDVLSKHITVTQTSHSLLTSTHTLWMWGRMRVSHSPFWPWKKAICGRETGLQQIRFKYIHSKLLNFFFFFQTFAHQLKDWLVRTDWIVIVSYNPLTKMRLKQSR